MIFLLGFAGAWGLGAMIGSWFYEEGMQVFGLLLCAIITFLGSAVWATIIRDKDKEK